MNDGISSAASIAHHLATEVEALTPGTRLPSQRELVGRYGASASTIAHALSLLAQRGLVETRPGSGTFRTSRSPRPAAGETSWQIASLELSESLQTNPGMSRRFAATGLIHTLSGHSAEVVDLNGGYLHPSLQPIGLLSAALTRVSRRQETWDRPPLGGSAPLRDWFAADIGGGLSRGDIAIAPGGQTALATALRALTQPGDPVIIESPTYPGTMSAALSASLRMVPVPLDEQGIKPEHLDDALSRSRARVVVVQPLFQNPTGAVMGPQRRRLIREIARRHGAFIIEDDFARLLAHADSPAAPPPMIADDGDGTVIHVRSLTKCTSPNLRIAAIASRGPVTTRLRDALTIDNLLVPNLLQNTALDVVTGPGWRQSLRQLGLTLAQRRRTTTAAIGRHLESAHLAIVPHGGFHLWLALPAELDGRALADAALAKGVGVTPGANYYVEGGVHQARLRISYVAAPTETDIEVGIAGLGDALRRALGDQEFGETSPAGSQSR